MALMQPYFLPYLGYFSRVAHAETFVVFDHVQFLRRGWMHRNRVARRDGGWDYVTLHVQKAPQDTTISAMRLALPDGGRARLRAYVDQAYAEAAPYHADAMRVLDACLDVDTASLEVLAVHALGVVSGILDLAFSPVRASALGVSKPEGAPVSSWALDACARVGARAYVNSPGGRDLYPPAPFTDAGIGLGFVDVRLAPYSRGPWLWEPGLSVLDALMFLPPSEVRRHVLASAVDWVAPVAVVASSLRSAPT